MQYFYYSENQFKVAKNPVTGTKCRSGQLNHKFVEQQLINDVWTDIGGNDAIAGAGCRFREGVRDGDYVVDVELEVAGFLLAENDGWENIGGSSGSYWTAQDFLTTNSASDNVAALNDALTNHRSVKISTPGVYEIDDTIWIPSNTRLEFVAGCTIKKATGSNFISCFGNKGRLTSARNNNIKLIGNGLVINRNEINGPTPDFDRSVGLISFFKVDTLTLSGISYSNGGAIQYLCQFSDINNFIISDINCESLKDALHFHGKCHDGVIRDIYTDTRDNGIVLLPNDYYNINPCMGDISNITIERWEDRGIVHPYWAVRFGTLSSSWAAWSNGNSYNQAVSCVNNGNIYTKTNVGIQVASVAPAHTSGIVTGADGISWSWMQSGTITEGNIDNILFKDCIFSDSGNPFSFKAVGSEYLRAIYPGTEGNSSINNIVFDNITYEPIAADSVLIWIADNVIKTTIKNCIIQPAFLTNILRSSFAAEGDGFTYLGDIIFDNCNIDLSQGGSLFYRESLCDVNSLTINNSDITLNDYYLLMVYDAVPQIINIVLFNTIIRNMKSIIRPLSNAIISSSGCTFINPTTILDGTTSAGDGIIFTSDGDTFTNPTGSFLFFDGSSYSKLFIDIINSIGVVDPKKIANNTVFINNCSLVTLGNELVGDPGFDGGWWSINGAGVSIAGGVEVLNNTGNGEGVYKTNQLTVGEVYRVDYTILNYVSGTFSFFDGAGKGAIRNSNGAYSEFYTAADVHITFYSSSAGSVMQIDNASVKEVL